MHLNANATRNKYTIKILELGMQLLNFEGAHVNYIYQNPRMSQKVQETCVLMVMFTLEVMV
jgi:hypothetical protein